MIVLVVSGGAGFKDFNNLNLLHVKDFDEAPDANWLNVLNRDEPVDVTGLEEHVKLNMLEHDNDQAAFLPKSLRQCLPNFRG